MTTRAALLLPAAFFAASGFAAAAASRAKPEPRRVDLEAQCYTTDLPPADPRVSKEKKKVIAACSAMIRRWPKEPLPYYYRADASFFSSALLKGRWGEPPYYNTLVGKSPPKLVQDYESALRLDAKSSPTKLPDPVRLRKRLGYAYAAAGVWEDVLKNWREALAMDPNQFDLRERVKLAQDQLLAPEILAKSPPKTCAELSFWTCVMISGCRRSVGPSVALGRISRSDLTYRGCEGSPRGLLAEHQKPPTYDCALLDQEHCEASTRCRFYSPLLSGESRCEIPPAAGSDPDETNVLRRWLRKLLQ